jgi:hypothetical protein
MMTVMDVLLEQGRRANRHGGQRAAGLVGRTSGSASVRAYGSLSGRLAMSLDDSKRDASGRAGARPQQIKSRERVRDLAEVYTNAREVNAMLDLVASMLPGHDDPSNIDRTFLEPACGSGNFLEEILRRKLAFVTPGRYGCGERYEHQILRCLASIYGIDISADNVEESRDNLRAVINRHLDEGLGSDPASPGFLSAVEVILETNIIRADALADAAAIEIVEYLPGPDSTFTREWSFLDSELRVLDLFSSAQRRDEAPVHYSRLGAQADPATAPGAFQDAA